MHYILKQGQENAFSQGKTFRGNSFGSESNTEKQNKVRGPEGGGAKQNLKATFTEVVRTE